MLSAPNTDIANTKHSTVLPLHRYLCFRFKFSGGGGVFQLEKLSSLCFEKKLFNIFLVFFFRLLLEQIIG